MFNILVLLIVQANLPETSPFLVYPNGFGEHLFSNVYSTYLVCITLHTVPVVFYLQGHLWYPHKRNILTSLPSDSRMDPNCHLHRYLDVIYARLPYMYFRVCSYQIHIFRDPVGVLKWRRVKFQREENIVIFYSLAIPDPCISGFTAGT